MAAGFDTIFLGLESDDPEVLKELGKTQNTKIDYAELCHFLRKKGFKTITAGAMFGTSIETPEDFLRNAAELAGYVDVIAPFNVAFLPETRTYLDAVKRGQLRSWDPGHLNLQTPVRDFFDNGMSLEEARQAYYKAISRSITLKGRPKSSQTITNNLYAQALFHLGKIYFGQPLIYLGGGLPRKPKRDLRIPYFAYRGFPLTLEVINQKRDYLIKEAIVVE